MRHIAPVVYLVTTIAGRSIGISEDESEHASAIDHGLEVVDLRLTRWVPRAVDALAVVLHAWKFRGRPKKGKVSQIHCRPKSDEEQKPSGVRVRHMSCRVGIRDLFRDFLLEKDSSNATTDSKP